MSECETETVPVQYMLLVTLSNVSGEQQWGPFSTKSAAESVVAALAHRENVTKVTVQKGAVV